MRSFARLLAVPFMALLAAAGPDTFTREELIALEAEKETAERELAALESAEAKVETDVTVLSRRLIAAAMESRRREEQASEAERRLIQLGIRRKDAMETLFADRAALEDLLAALVAAERSRPPALVVAPGQANRSVRSAILMGAAAPRLSDRANALADEIDEIDRLERSMHRETARLDAAEATLALKQAEIERLAAQKRAQYEDVTADADRLRQRARQLADEASGLRDLLAALEADAPTSPGRKPRLRPRYAALNSNNGGTVTDAAVSPARPSLNSLRPLGPKAIGAMVSPVAGMLSEAYGDRRPTGSRADGVTIVTRQGAQVVSPVDGVIEFADIFRSYGHMLILRTSDDYRVIMTGLGETYGTRGQSVAAGEPIGRMNERRSPPPELYLELRKDDRPENPAAWLEEPQGRNNG
ncbi:MAG: peptidoglycan DD-metalloendopeptidase family protein [Pseudomonadota bacterium]